MISDTTLSGYWPPQAYTFERYEFILVKDKMGVQGEGGGGFR
jgi:hypothetical protein